MEKWKTKSRFPTFPPHDSLSYKNKKPTRLTAVLFGNNPAEATGKIIVAKAEKYLTPNNLDFRCGFRPVFDRVADQVMKDECEFDGWLAPLAERCILYLPAFPLSAAEDYEWPHRSIVASPRITAPVP